MREIIYFDNAATTKVSDAAADVALHIMTEEYGNPSSVHDLGYEAEKRLKKARKAMLDVLGSFDRDDDFIFTSCGTEANNLAILGALATHMHGGKTVIMSDSEHPSVYNLSKKITELGFSVKYIPTKGGSLDLEFCEREFSKDVALITCMTANNETGALYDISSVNALRNRLCPDAILHSDCVQAFLKTEFPLCDTGADLISVSGHKVHAPKGVGGLYIKSGTRISNMLYGGGQEKSLRPGTEALPLICAFEKAVTEADISSNLSHIKGLREHLVSKVRKILPEVIINTPPVFLPHVVSMTLPSIKSEVMLRHLSAKGIFVSAGSACSSKHRENRVLAAFGLSPKEADTTIRISFCEYNTREEIDILVSEIRRGIDSLVAMK